MQNIPPIHLASHHTMMSPTHRVADVIVHSCLCGLRDRRTAIARVRISTEHYARPRKPSDLFMTATISKGQKDAIERLLLLSKIEQGLEQARRGETIPHEEVKRRIEAQIASWQR